jgi:hypothetical protein
LLTNQDAANGAACFSGAFLNSKMRGRVSSPKEESILTRCEDYGLGLTGVFLQRSRGLHDIHLVNIIGNSSISETIGLT